LVDINNYLYRYIIYAMYFNFFIIIIKNLLIIYFVYLFLEYIIVSYKVGQILKINKLPKIKIIN